ncbi:MAG: LAGLIDADG family homing endonuclease [Candidatus Micrarchaeota archaeon]
MGKLETTDEKATRTKALYLMKKQLHHLRNLKGSGTELISVYIPTGQPIHETANKLKEEAGQASNIKSKSTRKNVTDALERILQNLKVYGHVAPASGLAIFCGNVSDNPARTDIEIFVITPPEPVNVGMYRCDSRFFLEPLERMTDVKDTYGMVVLDGRECTLATLRGTNVNVLHRITSLAHAKIRKGGQCLAPDTMVFSSDGRLSEVREAAEGHTLKGADLAEMTIGDWKCADRFFTRSKNAYRLITHAPTMEITATAWHRFFTLTPDGVKEVFAKDLDEGDRVLVAKRIRHEGAEVGIKYRPERGIELDSREYAKLRQRRADLGWSQEAAAQKLGMTQMAVCRMERGEIPLSAQNIRKMYALYGLALDEGKYATQKLRLPEHYDAPLSYLLGVISGDGSLDGNRICIYEGHGEMVAHYEQAVLGAIGIKPAHRKVDKTGQKGSFAKKPYYEMRIYSLDFARFVQEEIGPIVAASDVRCIPDQILMSKTEVQAAFLSGLYDAEGYIHGKRVDIAMVSKKMMEQVNAVLLRMGIRASFGEKTVTGNPQWCVSISDLDSVRKFSSLVGFRRKDKKERLGQMAARAYHQQYVEQVPVDGREVYAYVKSLGLKTSDFHAASCFFRDVKPLGRATFEKSIAPPIRKRAQELGKSDEAEKRLGRWMSEDVGVARIAKKIHIGGEREYVDLTIPNAFNFVANGFIVHNSARRYERLIEESIEYYYKRIGEAMDRYFVGNNKGILVGGPGPAKEDFVKMSPFNYQIKILGVLDTGYTDEQGLREMMAKSGDLIAQQDAIVEKQYVDRFIKEVVSGGLAVYGEKNVREALLSKQAGTLIISEGLDWKRYHVKLLTTGEEMYLNRRGGEPAPTKTTDDQGLQVLSAVDLSDDLIELADAAGVKVEVISTNTSEGAQFLQSFYGIGAFLRYR